MPAVAVSNLAVMDICLRRDSRRRCRARVVGTAGHLFDLTLELVEGLRDVLVEAIVDILYPLDVVLALLEGVVCLQHGGGHLSRQDLRRVSSSGAGVPDLLMHEITHLAEARVVLDDVLA